MTYGAITIFYKLILLISFYVISQLITSKMSLLIEALARLDLAACNRYGGLHTTTPFSLKRAYMLILIMFNAFDYDKSHAVLKKKVKNIQLLVWGAFGIIILFITSP